MDNEFGIICFMINNNCGGYIALSTVLITLALVLLIGLSTSLLSINDLFSSYSGKKSNSTVDFAEACVEDVLLKLNEENVVVAGSMSLPQGGCNVAINTHVGNVWDFTVSTNAEGYYKNIRVNATRGSTVTITSWLDN